jgi:type I restriction system adenine methylase HsdM
MSSIKDSLSQNFDNLFDNYRGSMDFTFFKNYVITLVFLKFISEKNKANNTFNIIIPKNCDFDSLLKFKNQRVLGSEINNCLNQIANANPALYNVINYIDFNNQNVFGGEQNSFIILRDILELIISYGKNIDSSSNNDSRWADLFEYVMQKYSDYYGKSHSDISTPKEVSELISKLINVKSHNKKISIYDPTCGSGKLLISVSNQVNHETEIFGQEINSEQVFLAKLNLIIHGISNFQIEKGDVLNEPWFLDSNNYLRKFDYVVANPPFNLRMWNHNQGDDYFHRWNSSTGIPPINCGDYAFLLHIVNSLNNNGIGACIVSHGSLFRGGSEVTIRKYLIENGFIKGIVGLPAKLFSGTGIPSSILILENKPDVNKNDIFIIDASSEYLSDRFSNRLMPENIEKILDVWLNRKEVSGFSRFVSIDEIVENEYNLNLPRYLVKIDEFVVPEDSKVVELSSLLYSVPRNRANNEIGKLVKISDLSNDSFLYTIELDSLNSGEANRNFLKLTSPALLISKRFNKLKPSFYNASSDNPVFISPDIEAFAIIKEHSIDLSYLILQLNSDLVKKQAESYSEGAVMPNLRRQDLLKLKIVVPNMETQKSLVRQRALAEGARIQSDKSKIESFQLQSTIDTLLKERLNDFQWKLHDIRNGELLNLKGQVVALEMFAEDNPSLFDKVIDVDNNSTVLSSIKEIYSSVQRLATFLSDLYNVSDGVGQKEEIDILEFINEFCLNQLETNGNLFEIDYSDISSIKNDFNVEALLISVNKTDLNSIFSNIIGNAIRHGGFTVSNKINKIKVSISLDTKSEYLTIAVLNNGIASNISEIDFFADGGKAGLTANSGKGGHIIKVLTERNNGKAFQNNYSNGEAGEYTFEISVQFDYKKSYGL